MRKKIDWHAPYFIPELLYFQNDNSFTGSVTNEGEKEFRYRLSPAKEGEEGAERQMIRAEVWYGPFCYEKSKVIENAVFPLEEQGRSDAIDWLAHQYEAMIPEKAS
jgi:hypothetical protein